MKSAIFAKNILLSGFISFLFILPLLAAPRVTQAASFPYWGPLISCTGNDPAVTGIPNPKDAKGNDLPHCASICDLLATLQNIFFFMLTLALVVFAPFAVLWGAILMMTSGGSSERVTQGRTVIKNAILGILFVLSAFLIVNTFMFLLSKIATSSGGTGLPSKWYQITCSPKTGITLPK